MGIILDLLVLAGIFLLLMAVCSPLDVSAALLIYTILRKPSDGFDNDKKRSRIVIYAAILLASAVAVTALGYAMGSILSTWAVALIAGIPGVFAAGIIKNGLDCNRIKRSPEPDAEALGRSRKRRTFFIIMTVVTAIMEIALVYMLLMSAVAYM